MRTVKLQFFERNEEWGAAPVDAINDNNNSFDPFWHGIGLFHDVFEHYFEYKDPHFQGEYVQNIAGEVAATGATVYFNHILKLSTRLGMAVSGWDEITLRGLFTQSAEMMADTIIHGRVKYGNELSTALPEQPLTDYGFIEALAQYHLDTISTIKFNPDPDIATTSMDAVIAKKKKLASKKYVDSITLDKLQRLYRWGYNEAQKDIPNTLENRMAL